VANKLASLHYKRGLVLLALVALSVIGGKCGHPGMWDGPLG
jgi:hypothetical protein